MSGIRPLARTVILALAGIAATALGWVVASGPAVALGVMLVLAVVIDGLRFAAVDARRPLAHLVRTVRPNPGPSGEPMSVSLVSPSAEDIGPWPVEETLPAALAAGMVVHPPERFGAAQAERFGAAQAVPLAYDIFPPHRGQWTLGPCTVMRFSPLGLWWTRLAGRSTSQVVAWPVVCPLAMPTLAQDREGSAGVSGFVQPHQDNATVRDYSPGDDLRRIHWRSSARRGELMTRAEEPTDSERAWVGLVVPVGTPSARRELAISLAASWLVRMEQAGFVVDLACGGELRHGGSAEHLTRLATLTNAQASLPLPPSVPEGVSLLVVARGGNKSIPTELVVRPPYGLSWRVASAVAMVLSDSSADSAVIEELGWRVVRVTDGVELVRAAEGLAQFMEASLARAGAR